MEWRLKEPLICSNSSIARSALGSQDPNRGTIGTASAANTTLGDLGCFTGGGGRVGGVWYGGEGRKMREMEGVVE